MAKDPDVRRVTSEELLALPVHERLIKLDWIGQMWTLSDGTAILPVDYVGRLGRSVRLIDIREAEERTGPLGYIPGSEWVPLARVAEVAAHYPAGTPVVIVSRSGGARGAEAARALTQLGMEFVAVMDGGVVGWKKSGFMTTREAGGLARALEPTEAPAREGPPGPLTRQQVEEHIGDPHSVRWVKMAAFLLHGKASCVDGRDDHTVIGTPGGDAGEFLLALASIERVTGRPVDMERLPELMSAYLDVFGHFYIHSDTHASNSLIRSMRTDPELAPLLPSTSSGPREWRAYMQSPPEEVRPLVARHLTIPGNLGCGHLRLMLQHPERYMVRRELAEAVVRLCFAKRWNGVLELDVVILGGGHQEGAVVNIRLDRGVYAFTKVPLISPACGVGGVQMFVNHPQVADFMREQVARFFTTHPELLPLGEAEFAMLRKDMRRLAEIQQAATLAVLAKGLPVFDVVFRGAREFAVTEVGTVG